MELRERADDAAGDEAASAALRAEAVERREAEISRIGTAFAEMADGVGPIATIATIEESILVVRAFDRMLEQLAREEQRSGGDVP
jgi:pyruvate/2-oxoglutarate/acetoin dehydrogenase E1 component